MRCGHADHQRQAAYLEEALALYRKLGDRIHETLCLVQLAGLARSRGDVAHASFLESQYRTDLDLQCLPVDMKEGFLEAGYDAQLDRIRKAFG